MATAIVSNSSAIATPEQLAIEDVKRLANIVLGLRDQVFKNDLDYGVIPGTGTKPTLLLPGMEKLMRALHLRAEYVALSQIEDFDKNVIYYRYECRMIDYETGVCVSTAIGSANSRESKWRWRDQKRTCPKCGKETINRSKFAPKGAPQGTEPGWYCYAKAGGCGAEFGATDATITGQSIGRIENPDIFDQMNTIDKIAQKRALASAIKGAANVSEFYTVDLEDFQQYDTTNVVQGTFIEVKREEQPQPSRPATVIGAGVAKPAQQQSREPEPPPYDFIEGVAGTEIVQGGKSYPLGNTEPDPLNWTDEDPNLYRCDVLKVVQSKTATQYILCIKGSQSRIPLAPDHVSGKQIGDTEIVALKPGDYPLMPSWSVYADKLPNGAWDVQKIVTGMGEPEVVA